MIKTLFGKLGWASPSTSVEPKSLLVGKPWLSFQNPQVDFQLALAASGFSTCAGRLFPAENAGHLLPRNLSRASLLYSGISFGFSVASRISYGTERIVTVLISVSGWNIMGLVRVQTIRDWKGDLRASQYRILAFIICHNSLRCNILLTNPKVVNNKQQHTLCGGKYLWRFFLAESGTVLLGLETSSAKSHKSTFW